MKNLLLLFVAVSVTILISCNHSAKNTQKATPEVSQSIAVTGPNAIIYKTKADYYQLVPVIMNEEKTEIVSYPAPRDLRYKGRPANPDRLAEDFLLDNRGINENVAFLSITYEEYMNMIKTPAVEELKKLIIDTDPLTIMYNCGKRQSYKNEIDELNKLIIEGDFGNFQQLK
ncbi:MAG: hypothetical protein HQ565_02825 [Bacteroidetes bacterium]|nr:hypothetical protein [Bacteroidota bacterium]